MMQMQETSFQPDPRIQNFIQRATSSPPHA